MKMNDPTIFPMTFDTEGNLVQLVGMRPVLVLEARPHCKLKNHLDFQLGFMVDVAECYLSDEASPDCASQLAIVVAQPQDEEELVGIEYDNGSIDYVPQDILNII